MFPGILRKFSEKLLNAVSELGWAFQSAPSESPLNRGSSWTCHSASSSIEDSALDTELEERELRDGGFFFVSKRVETREELTRALRTFAPKLVISDYSLPNGLTALQISGNPSRGSLPLRLGDDRRRTGDRESQERRSGLFCFAARENRPTCARE